MKNLTLIFALLFVGVSASAKTAKVIRPFNYGEAFIFVEGRVEFAVYPNGEFDFHYNPRFLNSSVVHVPSPRNNISYNAGYNYDAFVQYDDFGAVTQIENVPVFYDYYGRIAQAGDVVINYNRHGLVSRVGGLQVRYNMFNQPVRYVGFINHYNTQYIYRPWHDYYMRPHVNHRVVYYEPYRAYYEPVRMDYYNYYNNYYQTNNYYYNKSNFYRPGQPVAAYNYGRRTTTQVPEVRSSENVTRDRTSTASTANEIIRNNNTGRSTDIDNNSYSESITTRRTNMEQHEAAVRAQRGSSAYNIIPSATRNSNESRNVQSSIEEFRAVERPIRATRATSSTEQSSIGRRSIPETNNNSQRSEYRGSSSNVRSSSTAPVSSQVRPVVREASGERGRSGIIR